AGWRRGAGGAGVGGSAAGRLRRGHPPPNVGRGVGGEGHFLCGMAACASWEGATGPSIPLLVPGVSDEVVVDGAEAAIVEDELVVAAADRVAPPLVVDAPGVSHLSHPVAPLSFDYDRRAALLGQDPGRARVV